MKLVNVTLSILLFALFSFGIIDPGMEAGKNSSFLLVCGLAIPPLYGILGSCLCILNSWQIYNPNRSAGFDLRIFQTILLEH